MTFGFIITACFSSYLTQDEVADFHPQASDLDYPGKLLQQQEEQQQHQEPPATEQTGLLHQNGNAVPAAVPQQHTDSQVS